MTDFDLWDSKVVALALRKHFDLLLENHMDLNAVISLLLMCIYYKHSWRPPPTHPVPTLQGTQLYCTNRVAHISHRRLSLFLFRSMVATRITPPLLCQRSFLLGCPVPIRQGARPFKTPREHETEPGWDVSWLPHLPVSGLVKLLSWGVTLGVQCVQIKCVCVCVHVHFAEGRQTQHHSFEQSEPHTTWWPCPFNLYARWHFHQNWPNLKK